FVARRTSEHILGDYFKGPSILRWLGKLHHFLKGTERLQFLDLADRERDLMRDLTINLLHLLENKNKRCCFMAARCLALLKLYDPNALSWIGGSKEKKEKLNVTYLVNLAWQNWVLSVDPRLVSHGVLFICEQIKQCSDCSLSVLCACASFKDFKSS